VEPCPTISCVGVSAEWICENGRTLYLPFQPVKKTVRIVRWHNRPMPSSAFSGTPSARLERGRVMALRCMYISMYIHRMSRRYTIAEARSRLPTIIDEAEAGVEVELTRRGEPVAVVVSLREFDRLRGKRRHFRDAYRKFLETHSLEEIGVEDDFTASTRDRTSGRKVIL